ncbi:TRAP transporter large permease [Fusibacter ferrireducens]|uniref:TRAP transporter large permease n=1 Tax=Fusibacter ferrireducens TaxID=2785058 RepID=A0ABS0A0W9_9FIRM|nr:TRAP transporter large permease [Fusibacter ferrireducens]MBF4695790.1 TRAP transporter large permease [Fusibacter ferrireducens]
MILIIFLVFIASLVFSIPIAIAIGLAAILPSLFDPGFAADVQFVIRGMVSGSDSTPMLAIPLFILSGSLMARGGISKRLFDVFAFIVGKRTAGMPIAVIITSLFYGAISGSGIATTAAVGGMTIPILVSLGYDKVFSAALVATSGSLGVIIPPSIPFIMYGLTTGTSVGALFTAGIVPGLLIAFSLMVYAYIYCKINGEDREKIDENLKELRAKGFFGVMKDSFWALLAPVIILGGIYSGVVTPTEAACVSVFYALIVCLFIYKTIQFRDVPKIFKETVNSYGPLIFLIALATVFGRVLTLLRAPMMIGDFLTGTFSSSITLLLAINVVFFILGMFLDVGPAIVILAPILLPAVMAVGIDPVHFGIIMTANLAIGMVTPPFGVNLFVASPLVDTPVMDLGKKAIPFIISFAIALMIITFVPALSLMLL